MDLCIHDVPRLATSFDVMRAIAKILHGHSFVATHLPNQSRPVNFQVVLVPDSVPNSIRNGGTGILTLPDFELGRNFLHFLRTRRWTIKVLNCKKPISFRESATRPHYKTVHTLQKVPYQDPTIIETKQEIIRELKTQICIQQLQFGVFIKRPNGLVFSSEWEEDYTDYGDARLSFVYEHKLLRIKTGDHSDTVSRSIAVTFVNLKRMYIGWDYGNPFILFHLTTPPPLETESMYRPDTGRPWEDNRHSRHRLGYFDQAHKRVAPYAHQLRLVLKNSDNIKDFTEMCQKAQIQAPILVPRGSVEVQHLEIFSSVNVRKVNNWIIKLDWPVAFQCEALLCNLRLNATELLELKPSIDILVQKGTQYASQVLRHFHTVMRSLRKDETVCTAFARANKEFDEMLVSSRAQLGNAYFEAYHVSFTPTAMRLEGPFTHQSNRVVREYADYQDYFIRVDFRDEDRLQYRWDREVDGATFVRERVGTILRHGFTVAGRTFEFLGYSQSQLRSHSVFFMMPFQHPTKGWITPSIIRDKLGIFDKVSRCPALYAARLSQAFSGTEASVRLQADQWEEVDDIIHHDRNFTDGSGMISPNLAKLVWQRLCLQRQCSSSAPFTPVAFQIRFGGYKGMVAIEPRLEGIKLVLRPSMRKFEVHERDNIELEIARAFEYPGRMYLNRPLIQILEDLGVKKKSFLELQEAAVVDVQTARNKLSAFAKLLDANALGKAFSLPYLLRSLDKIGCEFEHHDPKRTVTTPFVRGMIDTAVVSILRDLKHSARIPVPKGWNLVGVADESGFLGPGEIYACVWERDMEQPIWLEGPVMISRSPTIHPGDVQMVHAIGRPPAGSIFEDEPLPNVVVFPCEGKRDLASCLGGGDLDGDLYLVCQFPSLLLDPKKCHRPGDYPPTKRKDIGRPSTIDDVADFVVEYINSDMVGLLSTNHLILSDQSSFGTRDRGCLKLAELCSVAVDYPKSGIPVDMNDTPRFLIPNKPDWRSDEVVNPRQTDYYESTRAIGHLFRAIKLEESVRELSFDPKTSDLKDKPKQSPPPAPAVDAISLTLEPIVNTHVQSLPTDEMSEIVRILFSKYTTQLKYTCLTHTLSHDPDVRLREEEIVMGTILAKCTQARWRKDRIEQMRISASQLVRHVSAELNGPDGVCAVERLTMGWAAWKYARSKCPEFGHNSFGLIALEIVFRALEELEDIPAVTV